MDLSLEQKIPRVSRGDGKRTRREGKGGRPRSLAADGTEELSSKNEKGEGSVVSNPISIRKHRRPNSRLRRPISPANQNIAHRNASKPDPKIDTAQLTLATVIVI